MQCILKIFFNPTYPNKVLPEDNAALFTYYTESLILTIMYSNYF